jgi:ribosomal protein S18 acetylase RimI-like enzyme
VSRWRIELLAKQHGREGFDCGQETLNLFLRTYASQNARRDISRTYVATPEGSDDVAGFYTLSSGSVAFALLPEELANRLPRYPVPAAHLARLAVDRRSQGKGLGGILLVDALKRVRDLADQIGIHAVTVHALNDSAKGFYQAHGFLPLLDDPHHLFLPMATIRKL